MFKEKKIDILEDPEHNDEDDADDADECENNVEEYSDDVGNYIVEYDDEEDNSGCWLDNVYVIVVNGVPESGKDTFTKEVLESIQGNSIPPVKTMFVSTIDLVRSLVEEYIYQYAPNTLFKKDAKGRKLLCDVKRAFVEYDNAPFKVTVESILRTYYDCEFIKKDKLFVVVHSREPDEIQKFVDYFPNCYTVLIEKKFDIPKVSDTANTEECCSSDSLDSIRDFPYEYILINKDKEEFLSSANFFGIHLLETEGLCKNGRELN
jgi:hypothetical protein